MNFALNPTGNWQKAFNGKCQCGRNVELEALKMQSPDRSKFPLCLDCIKNKVVAKERPRYAFKV